ncbi:nucleoplasmin-like [Dendropsophus ebraccatus]|uniref:nucleoplasmin-like n=1 Tax=Dendropsophus ebraccatus TaxID=150705 RepID=UPI003831E58D
MPREQSFSLSTIYSAASATQVCEVWGCELSSSCRRFVYEAEADHRVHLLGLWTICLGDTEDETHVIAVESEQTQGQPVTMASLHPSLLPMVNVHGMEITLPVTFLLTSGSGPVYISGQHVTCKCYLCLENGGISIWILLKLKNKQSEWIKSGEGSVYSQEAELLIRDQIKI